MFKVMTSLPSGWGRTVWSRTLARYHLENEKSRSVIYFSWLSNKSENAVNFHVVTSFRNSCLIGQWMNTVPLRLASLDITHTERHTVLISPTPGSAEPISQQQQQQDFFISLISPLLHGPVSFIETLHIIVCHGIWLPPYSSLCLSSLLVCAWLTVETVQPGRSSPRRISPRDRTSTSCWNMLRPHWEVGTCAWPSCCPTAKT